MSRRASNVQQAERNGQMPLLEEHVHLLGLAHVLIRDLDDRITFWNDEAEVLYGFSAQEALGQVSHTLLQTQHPILIADVREALQTHGVWDGDVIQTTRDGRPLIVASHQVLHRNPQGEPLAILEVNTDITERKRAEAALRYNQEMFSALVANAPFGVYMVDADFRLRQINRGSEAVFSGIDPLIGRDFAEILRIIWQEPFATEAIERFRHTLHTGESFISPPIVEPRANIEEIQSYDWQIHRVTLPDGRYGTVCYFYDLSEQKRLEESVRRAAERDAFLVKLNDALRPLADAVDLQAEASRLLGEHLQVSRVAYAEVEGDEIVVRRDYNNGIPSMVGRYPKTAFGQKVERAFSTTGTVIENDIASSPNISEAERSVYQTTHIAAYIGVTLFKQGSISAAFAIHHSTPRVWTRDEISLAEDVADRIWTIIERARAEQERAHLLEREQQARAEAQEAVRIRDEFLSVASHELKTPLTSMLGNAQLLQRRAEREDGFTDRTRRAITVIVDQTSRLNKMIATLLDISRIEQGQLSIERIPLDLCALTERVVSEIQPTVERHTITVACHSKSLIVLGDALRLEQVLQNLIQNAIKYSLKGGTIAVDVQQQTQVCVSVTDQGMGIPAAALPHLFRRFYRADNVETKHITGMGIGLFVVKEIMTLHGGTVQVESTEGKGSTFTFCLPLHTIEEEHHEER